MTQRVRTRTVGKEFPFENMGELSASQGLD